MKQSSAFTLIELMVAVVILGILASLSMVSLADRKRKAEFNGAWGQVRTIAAAQKTYSLTQGHYIATTSTADTNSELGLEIRDGYFRNYRVTSIAPVRIVVTTPVGTNYTFDGNGNRVSCAGADCLP